MRTSEQWWVAVKADPELLMEWLKKQYHGEKTAAVRLTVFMEGYAQPAGASPQTLDILKTIIEQEETHAHWVAQLLQNRGEDPTLLTGKYERYWEHTLPGIDSFETGCAVAAHAEAMRLDRIRVIVQDPHSPADIREVFSKILPQEEFHERAFSKMAGEDALLRTQDAHDLGMIALGLSA